MMNEVKFADLLDQLGQMSMSQLEQLEESAHDAQNERRERFMFLTENLHKYLETIFKEFPNASIYLTKSPTEKIDLLDYILPENFLDICKIGD